MWSGFGEGEINRKENYNECNGREDKYNLGHQFDNLSSCFKKMLLEIYTLRTKALLLKGEGSHLLDDFHFGCLRLKVDLPMRSIAEGFVA